MYNELQTVSLLTSEEKIFPLLKTNSKCYINEIQNRNNLIKLKAFWNTLNCKKI